LENFQITTASLCIRNLAPKDLIDFYVYRSDPRVTKYQGFDVMSKQEAEQFINEQKDKVFGQPGEWVQYGIENKSARKIIGDCAIKLHVPNGDSAEIGITISHLEQQKGYAKEALSALMGFLFDTCNVHRIVEIVDTENIASINLLTSAGFRQAGHFIENIFFKGNWGSEFQYAMLRSEWNAKERNQQV
jgi:RimJ/RimL family protein N-acetyltransferase